MEEPFISVVIPARNTEDIIENCLKSLREVDYPKDRMEVIIADGLSTDRTGEIAGSYGAKVIANPGLRVVSGRNRGFEAAQGELIAFSDADCVMDKDWIKNSIKYFKDPTIAGVGGPNITPPDETSFGKAVGFIFNQAIFSAGSIHGRLLKKIKEVKSIPGCNVIYRKNVLDKVMPMDKSLVEAEDYVMNQKIRQLGYRLVYTPDTIVWHYRRPSPKKFLKQMYRYAIGRLLIGKKDRKNINLVHIMAGLSLPIFFFVSALLVYINPMWFIVFIAAVALCLIIYFFMALVKLKSLKAAISVPLVIVILFSAWSTGFLRELFFPIKSRI